MFSNWASGTALAIILVASFYQWYLKDLLLFGLGLGRIIQSISDFPYECRRIQHSRLEGCEDMWLDDEARLLYAACSSSISRAFHWCPSVSKLNATGRKPGGDWVSVLNVDDPGKDGLFGLHQMIIIGYDGATGDESLDLHGFDVEIISDTKLRFWMINHRPPVDEQKNYLDAIKLGANSTVEVFDVARNSDKMVYVKTIADKAIATPNKLAANGDGGFIVTNDRSSKVGLRRELDLLIGGGNLVYCGRAECHTAAISGFNYPNGMVKGSDGLYYVPSSGKDEISVMKLLPDLTMKKVDVIRVGMPVDNLSVDKDGDIYAAAFPDPLTLLKSLDDPYNLDAPSTIWRIRKIGSKYEIHKVIEDKEAKTMGGATIARHDVKTGRLFIGGATAPYITVCDPQ